MNYVKAFGSFLNGLNGLNDLNSCLPFKTFKWFNTFKTDGFRGVNKDSEGLCGNVTGRYGSFLLSPFFSYGRA